MQIFIRTAKDHTYKLSSSLADGVRHALDHSPTFQLLGQIPGEDSHVNLQCLIWGDNCQKLTAVRFRLVDSRVDGGIFPNTNGLSPVYDLLEIIGGEGDLPPYIPACTASIQEGMATLYQNDEGLASCSVFKAKVVGDHHFLNVMYCIPGSSSLCRDSFGQTLQHYWSLFPFDGDSHFELSDNADNFLAIQEYILRAQSFNQLLATPKPRNAAPSIDSSARSIFCGCAKGDCSKNSCKCKKNNLPCTAKCHGKTGHARCTRLLELNVPAPSHEPDAPPTTCPPSSPSIDTSSNVPCADIVHVQLPAVRPLALPNLGNTCWSNSVLQCVRSHHSLVSSIQSIRTNVDDSSTLLSTLQTYLADPSRSNHVKFLDAWMVAANFPIGAQQDAGEGFTKLFQQLNIDADASCRVDESRTVSSTGLIGFVYQTVMQPECNLEHTHTSRGEKMDSLQLSLLESRARVSFTLLIEKFFASSTLSDYQCTEGDCRHSAVTCAAVVRGKLSSLPPVLIFRLRRLSSTFGTLHLMTTPIVPIFQLHLEDAWVMGDTSDVILAYTLTGVIVRLGERIERGHYVAYTRDSSGCWWRCSDQHIQRVGYDLTAFNQYESEVVKRSCMFFYQRGEDHAAKRVETAKSVVQCTETTRALLPSDVQVSQYFVPHASLFYGRQYSVALWLWSDRSWQGDLTTVPPSMHNLFSCQLISLECVQGLVNINDPAVRKMLGMFAGLTTTISNGEIGMSMGTMREIACSCAHLWEKSILEHSETCKRIFAYIMRFASLVAQQIYSKEVPTARSLLAFEVHTYLWWLLTTYLSALNGGVSVRSRTRNHTERLYWIDMVHHMGNFFTKFKMPWPHVAEDAFEASFKTYKMFSALIGRSSDLVGLRQYCAKQRVLSQLIAKRRGIRGGGDAPSSKFPYIDQADICIHPSIYKWLCPDLNCTGRSLPIAAVSFRAFLRRIDTREDGQHNHVEFLGDKSIIFRVGRPRRPNESIPLITLCFPIADDSLPADSDDSTIDTGESVRSIFCGCAKGDCSRATCVCKKNSLQCTPKCHGKTGHDRCARFMAVQNTPPPAAPGLTSMCQCPSEHEGYSAPENIRAWCTKARASYIAVGNDPVYWERTSRLTPSTQLDLRERFRRSLKQWRDTRVQVAGYKKAPKAFRRRELFFIKWATKCCFDLAFGRRLRADPVIVRYHMMGLYMKGSKQSKKQAEAKERARLDERARQHEFERDSRDHERNNVSAQVSIETENNDGTD
jgi:ubiquitin C-terminal hydrolase